VFQIKLVTDNWQPMSRIIHPEKENEPIGGFGCMRWRVNDEPVANTAVPFWSALLDEMRYEYADDTVAILNVSSDGLLHPDLLDPANALLREMEELDGKDFNRAFHEALTVLEITGPPLGVRLRLMRRGIAAPLLAKKLSPPDAETLSFLLVWLLAWAGVPQEKWNDRIVSGSFTATDPKQYRAYTIQFQLATRHLSEGLYDRELTLDGSIKITS